MSKLQRISVLPLAKILSVLQAIMGLFLGIFATIGSMITQKSRDRHDFL